MTGVKASGSSHEQRKRLSRELLLARFKYRDLALKKVKKGAATTAANAPPPFTRLEHLLLDTDWLLKDSTIFHFGQSQAPEAFSADN